MRSATATKPFQAKSFRPALTSLIAVSLAAAGLILTSVSWWFLLLTAAGGFGPGLLRELGILHDKDEHQLLTNYRAGYHAYLAGGTFALVLLAYIRSHEGVLQYTQEISTLLVAVLWFTWLLSSLFSYWGVKTAAFRILICFGCVWFVFAVLSNLGEEWTGWTALLLHPLLAAPFFLAAWLSQRFPRLSGALLLVVSLFLMQFFGVFRMTGENFINKSLVLILFVGPLLAAGLSLVASRPAIAVDEDESD